jgi:aldose 1-epimerase
MAVSCFGHLRDGQRVHVVRLGREPGPELHVLDLGATVQSLFVTGGDGQRRNIVLGHATPHEYLASRDYLGGTIGRYANRIAAGTFELDGRPIEVGVNDRGNHLHGGPDGFDRRIWTIVDDRGDEATFALTSPDGDQGFPGELQAQVTYTVEPGRVRVALSATTSATTVVNLTNHAYFNLAGAGSGSIDGHELQVRAGRFTPVDCAGIPLNDHVDVSRTPFDFRASRPLGPVVRSGHSQVVRAAGVDHNFVVDGTGMRTAATLHCSTTATQLEVATDQPGLQVYTGNHLDGRSQSTGQLLRAGDGIALEPQAFPDSPNRDGWPSTVLRPGECYSSTIEWTFSPT